MDLEEHEYHGARCWARSTVVLFLHFADVPALHHNLPVAIASPLTPLKAANQLPEGVGMLCKLRIEGGHRGFGLEVGLGEQNQLSPVRKPFLLPQVAISPTRGDRKKLWFWGTLLLTSSMSRVTITGDTTAAEGARVARTTSICRDVGELYRWECGEQDRAKRGGL